MSEKIFIKCAYKLFIVAISKYCSYFALVLRKTRKYDYLFDIGESVLILSQLHIAHAKIIKRNGVLGIFDHANAMTNITSLLPIHISIRVAANAIIVMRQRVQRDQQIRMLLIRVHLLALLVRFRQILIGKVVVAKLQVAHAHLLHAIRHLLLFRILAVDFVSGFEARDRVVVVLGVHALKTQLVVPICFVHFVALAVAQSYMRRCLYMVIFIAVCVFCLVYIDLFIIKLKKVKRSFKEMNLIFIFHVFLMKF